VVVEIILELSAMNLVEPLRPLSPEREPAHMLAQTRAAWGGRSDLWVFGYASLIWRPEFESVEQRPARVHGWHRALEMSSRMNRGTPEFPGLVFALVGGGLAKAWSTASRVIGWKTSCRASGHAR
jgi:cation transport protein ChaC